MYKSIVFHVGTGGMVLRGSVIAVYNHACVYQERWGGRVLIVYQSGDAFDPLAYKFVANRFQVKSYRTLIELQQICSEFDLLYIIKYGTIDQNIVNHPPMLVHCVFDMSQPHGKYYLGVSQTLSAKFGLPDRFIEHPRPTLFRRIRMPGPVSFGFQDTDVVIGRHGGLDTWNLPFAMACISQIVRTRSNIKFLLMNTPQWDDHPSIVHLPPIADDVLKYRILSQCKYFILAERHGHTFGYAVLEALMYGMIVIYYRGDDVWNSAHYRYLDNMHRAFREYQDLHNILYSL